MKKVFFIISLFAFASIAFAGDTLEDMAARAGAETFLTAAVDPCTTPGTHAFSEFTPDEDNFVYYTADNRTYGIEVMPIVTPAGFDYSDTGIITVPNTTNAENYISLWFNNDHSLSDYTAGIVLAAAENSGTLAANNYTNVMLRTFIWADGATEGVRADDYFINITDGEDRTQYRFDTDYTAEGNEALELRIYSSPNAESTTLSGYSHVTYNLYADKVPTTTINNEQVGQ
ncbi:MAG: hypothetical protein J6332_03440 [Abditibacteriota bacterium]|nr:hypothetical protein [Abditibacteriota bacterium]